jgi:hypothetical protein
LLLWANHGIDYDVMCANSYGCFKMDELCESRQARGNLQLCFRQNAKIPKVDLSAASSQSATAPPAASAPSAASASTTPVHKAAPIGARQKVSPAAALPAASPTVPAEPPTAESQAALLESLKEQLATALKPTEVAQKIRLPLTSKAGPQSAPPPANLLMPRVVAPPAPLQPGRVVAPPGHSSSSSSAAELSSNYGFGSSSSRPAPNCISQYDYWVIGACALYWEAHIYKQWGCVQTTC